MMIICYHSCIQPCADDRKADRIGETACERLELFHVVVDNSPNKRVRKQINEIFESEKVGNVPVPIFIDKLICHRLAKTCQICSHRP